MGQGDQPGEKMSELPEGNDNEKKYKEVEKVSCVSNTAYKSILSHFSDFTYKPQIRTYVSQFY